VDFSLQLPGYAVVFAATVGCALAQSHRGARESRANGTSCGGSLGVHNTTAVGNAGSGGRDAVAGP
jgi:hypothetical protein